MAYTIPTTEPEQVRAGDRIQWTKSLSDFPASTWSLTYYLRSDDVSGQINITGTADGDDHLIDVSTATSSSWTAGDYWWESFVSDGTSRYFLSAGEITIKPNFATLTEAYDGRHYWQEIIDLHKAALKLRANRPEGSYSFSGAGQSFTYASHREMLEFISFAEEKLAVEKAKEDEKLGIQREKNVFIRFT